MTPPFAGDWDVQLTGDGRVVCKFDPNILLLHVSPVELEFSVGEAEQLGPQMVEAIIQASGHETVTVKVCELDEGDLIQSIGMIVDYIQIWERSEVGVWSGGRCIMTFRDPELNIDVIRKIT